MCGQFTLTLDPEELQELLDLGTFVHIVQPRFNIWGGDEKVDTS